jgi:glycosyltransferase involved in cell wall biosynthesis
MRILQIGKYYPPYKGGMETVLRDLCEGLLEKGHDLRVLVAGSESEDSHERISTGDTGCDLIRCGSLGKILSQPLTPSLYTHIRRALVEFQPDVVQVHLPNPLASCILISLRSQLPPGALLTAWYHADITRQKFSGLLVKPLVDRMLRICDGICVSTPALIEHSRHLSKADPRLRTIPFGIKPERWQTTQPAQRRGFLFVGRLVYYKGLSVLLDAMHKVPEARLKIVGGGPLDGEVRDTIKTLNLQDRIDLVGEVDDDRLRDIMSESEALILPSDKTSETFGLVQLEAMACGLPVVSCRLPTGVSTVNVHRVTGLQIMPGDVEDLARAMAEILENPGEARQWGREGLMRVQTHYHRDRMADDFIGWIDYLRHIAATTGGMTHGI